MNEKIALIAVSLIMLLGGISTLAGIYLSNERVSNLTITPKCIKTINVSEDANNIKFEIIENYLLTNISYYSQNILVTDPALFVKFTLPNKLKVQAIFQVSKNNVGRYS